MKFLIRRITICLLIGIITTIAVSWLCALFIYLEPNGPRTEALTSNSLPSAAMVIALEASGAMRIYSYPVAMPIQNPAQSWLRDVNKFELKRHVEKYGVDPNLLPEWSKRTQLDPNNYQVACDDARGWPFLAMSSVVVAPNPLVLSRDQLQPFVQKGIVLPRFSGDDGASYRLRILPLNPIWKGFLINSTIYGFAWYIVLLLINTFKYRWRVYCQCCPKCSYKLLKRFEFGCPECGWER